MDSRSLNKKSTFASKFFWGDHQETNVDALPEPVITHSSTIKVLPSENYIVGTCVTGENQITIYVNARHSEREELIKRTNAYIKGDRNISSVPSMDTFVKAIK
ncbi:MAG: hypothetical protein ABFS24_00040 [Pseudomonadota bacterium]